MGDGPGSEISPLNCNEEDEEINKLNVATSYSSPGS